MAVDAVTIVGFGPVIVSVGDYADLSVMVTDAGVPVPGAVVTASSSDTAKATAQAITEYVSGPVSGWGVNALVYADPKVVTPRGVSAYRFTEVAVTDFRYCIPTLVPTTVSGRVYRMLVEVAFSASPAVRDAILIVTPAANFGTDDSSYFDEAGVPLFAGGPTRSGYAMGSGWYRLQTERTASAAAPLAWDIESYDQGVGTGSYAGSTGNYWHIGRTWVEEVYAVTDAFGRAVVRVRGVASGTASITATSGAITSPGVTASVGAAQPALYARPPESSRTMQRAIARGII